MANNKYGDKSMTHIEIPEGVVEIEEGAFKDFGDLESITIPKSVKKIGKRAFDGCKSLYKLTLPNSVEEIGDGAFSGCESLETVTIPEGVKRIESWTFSSCSDLEHITLPESLEEIDEYAFCGSKLESITIPKGVKKIGERAFWDCKILEKVIIPKSVIEIGREAFLDCKSLTSSITIPKCVKVIGKGAFDGCEKLKSVTISEGVTRIMREAFCKCKSLESIEIPGSVEEIGINAFCECEGLSSLTLNEGLKVLNSSSFMGCESLKSVKIPKSVTEIGAFAFNYCEHLESVIIHEGAEVIGDYAFDGCNSLTGIIIPESVKKIGYSAFGGSFDAVPKFKITIPETVVEIGENVLNGRKGVVVCTPKGSCADTQLQCEKEYYQSKRQIEEAYKCACKKIKQCESAEDLKSAYMAFAELQDYKDSRKQAEKCLYSIALHQDNRIWQVVQYLKSKSGDSNVISAACDSILEEKQAEEKNAHEKYIAQKSELEEKIPPLHKQLEDKQAEYNEIAKKLFAGKKRQALQDQIAEINKQISNIQDKVKALGDSQEDILRKIDIKTGAYIFPARTFYDACSHQGIISLEGDAFAVKKAQKIMMKQFGAMNVPEMIAGRYLENVNMLFEMGRDEQNEKDKMPVIGRIEEDDMPAYTFNNKYKNSMPNSKTKMIMRDKIQELDSQISKMREGEEAMKDLSRMMYTSYSTTPKRDWAVAGGIASGLAGTAAGVAVAMDAMAENARIEQQNAANRAAAKESSMSMYKMAIDSQVSRIRLECDRDQMREQLSALDEKIIMTDQNAQELFTNLKCVCTSAYIERKAASIVIMVETQNHYHSGASSSHLAIDGDLLAKIYCDDNVLIDTIPVVLPMNGIRCGESVNLIGVSQMHMNGAHSNYRVEIEPRNLWITEI